MDDFALPGEGINGEEEREYGDKQDDEFSARQAEAPGFAIPDRTEISSSRNAIK